MPFDSNSGEFGFDSVYRWSDKKAELPAMRRLKKTSSKKASIFPKYTNLSKLTLPIKRSVG
jgi:hypothetical protein